MTVYAPLLQQWKNMSHQQSRQNFDETEINGSGRLCYINSVDTILMKQKSKAAEECGTSTASVLFLMKQKSMAVEEHVTSTVSTK